jgi:hypothetical protein
MTSEDFDPRKFIDREFEQELFEDLLQFKDAARILAIQDEQGGMGKSQLLEKFRYRCRTVKPRTPVSLIKLDQLPGNSPLDFVNIAVKDFASFGIDFVNFNRYETARICRDFTPIGAALNLQQVTFAKATDVTIAGVATKIQHAQNVFVSPGVTEFTPEQDIRAKEVCLQAFFSDLKELRSSECLVALLDAYEKCPKNIKDWIEEYLLDQLFFDIEGRPKRFILVIAGREVPNFETRWAVEDCADTVKSVRRLGTWTKRHVEECLHVFGLDFTPEELDHFYGLITMGIAPSEVVHLIQTLLISRGKLA